jgi:hypothetical protein
MEARKNVLGLRIRYELQPLFPKELGDYPENRLKVYVSIEKGSPSREFITGLEIREAIAKSRLKEGLAIGTMGFEYKPLGRQLCNTSYYPFTYKDKSPFAKKGIASLIESRAIEHARKVFPNARLMTHYAPSDLRIAQIKKRGITFDEITEGAPLQKYRKALRKKLAADLIKGRRARRRAP